MRILLSVPINLFYYQHYSIFSYEIVLFNSICVFTENSKLRDTFLLIIILRYSLLAYKWIYLTKSQRNYVNGSRNLIVCITYTNYNATKATLGLDLSSFNLMKDNAVRRFNDFLHIHYSSNEIKMIVYETSE